MYGATAITTTALLIFFYLRDNNREPVLRLIEAFILGVVISLQVEWVQSLIPADSILITAFIISALFEESIKFLTLMITLFRSSHFTQKIDGITYAVFLSLGFATAENAVRIVTAEIGIVRAFTATPAHALFATSMGYWLGMYKFRKEKHMVVYALAIPVILHGIYNTLIMTDSTIGLVLFTPYIIALWVKGTYKIDALRAKVVKK